MMVVSPSNAQWADVSQQWQSLNAQVSKAYQAGEYSKGIAPAEKALALARGAFGDRDPRTLNSLNSAAMLYNLQGRYDKAEPLFQEALEKRREVLGPRHPDTLASFHNFANLYENQGRYDAAESQYREALQGRREVLGSRHPSTLNSLNSLASLYKTQGRYGEAEPLLQEALQQRREALGPRHPDTLNGLNNLAGLYQARGRYGEAKPLFEEALQGRREVLGPRHPDTLLSLNNLAMLYLDQGRYGEAEQLFQEALEERREVLGLRHPQTLVSQDNLAGLYQARGRYGEAERLLQDALHGRREVLGPRHPDTLLSLSNLAALYGDQGRYDEAEPLYQEVLRTSREALGPHHPNTLLILHNLAWLYQENGYYDKAHEGYRELLEASREALGPRHPNTLMRRNNLASLYYFQSRYTEAEPLYQEVLQERREVLGLHHPDTLTSVNNLAALYTSLGRHGDAVSLYQEVLEAAREALGPRHPNTLLVQLNMTTPLVNSGRLGEAARMLQEMEPHLLDWIGQEVNSTEAGAVRRQLVSSRANFQNVVLSLATGHGSSDARRLGGSVMLRFKLLQGEEEAYLARLARRSADPRVRALADEVGRLRLSLVGAWRSALSGAAQGTSGTYDEALQAWETKQRALGEVSRDYKDHLRVLTASFDDLRTALPIGAVLVEFRQFQLVDFRTGRLDEEPHFAAVLLAGSDEPVVADLGPVSELGQPPAGLTDEAAAALYQKLFARFEDKVAGATSVYIAPDGFLNLIPFARLKLADGRYWAERQQLRLLQSGRDLLRLDPDKPARGLLALGGIDFGTLEVGKPDSVLVADRKDALTRAARTLRDFKKLPASGEEAVEVKEWYQLGRKDEPADAWLGADASKARLMALESPPRVLHLATHGFYLPNEHEQMLPSGIALAGITRPNAVREPMLLSGIALAGANRELEGNAADGILFALEAQGLNLDGSELVVLSACDTARGSLDYSEGVYGLVRALRTAGARNVLVTLWPLNDGEARDFMSKFYKTWLSQSRSDPAKALRDIQLAYLKDDKLKDPRIWAPYILIE
ncbi:tetratricopeptide repeat protein [Bradyrhizobium sp. CSA112]|uniref:CHAT domain-containing tetratricopeptide repeat protein n=1 Tax=Bradyrhizobium sp. CSA112 TaxID=2699170 RepID=UPI0023AF1A37|nr:CHAT domain-containing protein [Bradyrhizobium sp. CSA112]MDE5454137.1 tetratricopeptide repeat protein [Bradyrhizobium sp. CSA112]